MDTTESRDTYELLTERHRAGSMIVTSNRGPDEWLPTFADPVRALSAIDPFTNNSYDLVVEGDSYRPRMKPKRAPETEPNPQSAPSRSRRRGGQNRRRRGKNPVGRSPGIAPHIRSRRPGNRGVNDSEKRGVNQSENRQVPSYFGFAPLEACRLHGVRG